MKKILKFIMIFLLSGLGVVHANATDQSHQTALAASRPNEIEVARWKEIVGDRTGKIAFKEKIRALVMLAEVEGNDVGSFLNARKAQLDADVKTAGFTSARENKSFKSALYRVINSRTQTRVAERE